MLARWTTDHYHLSLNLGISEGCFIFLLRFITFGGLWAHLAYHLHKSGRKTSIITMLHVEPVKLSWLSNWNNSNTPQLLCDRMTWFIYNMIQTWLSHVVTLYSLQASWHTNRSVHTNIDICKLVVLSKLQETTAQHKCLVNCKNMFLFNIN